MNSEFQTFGKRVGRTVHESPLRFKVRALMTRCPLDGASSVEEWLMDVANLRGATMVQRPGSVLGNAVHPCLADLSNAELAAALCLYPNEDQPQLLRLAAQIISSGKADIEELRQLARRERVGAVIAELARLALKVEPGNPVWRQLLDWLRDEKPHRQPLLHWQRLAEPVMNANAPNAAAWVLVK